MKQHQTLIHASLLALLIMLIAISSPARAQESSPWNGKQAAVVLTYDDALAVQLQHAVPLLDSLDLKATFYLTGYFQGFRDHIDTWKKVAKNGHELGNHTLFHPCKGGPGREWVQPDYDLSTYTEKRMEDEIRMTNVLLQTLDGRSIRTFAYPCGDTTAGGSSYIDDIKDDFPAARGVKGNVSTIEEVDLYNTDTYVINGQSGDELIGLVKQAMSQNGLVVFLFHGVGGGHSLNVSLEAHRQLLQFLKQNEQQLWVAPMIEIAEHVKIIGKRTKVDN